MNKIDKAINFLVEEDPLFSNPIMFNDKWLDKHTESWTRRPDGKIDVEGRVLLEDLDLLELPYEFGIVNGTFSCHGNQLTSLKGCPEFVAGHFSCSDNSLPSLVYGPEKVEGDYSCDVNNLISLRGCPKEVRNFYSDTNQLTSLTGAPERVGGSFYVANNPLESLEGAPKHIGRRFRSDQFTEMQYREYVKEHYK